MCDATSTLDLLLSEKEHEAQSYFCPPNLLLYKFSCLLIHSPRTAYKGEDWLKISQWSVFQEMKSTLTWQTHSWIEIRTATKNPVVSESWERFVSLERMFLRGAEKQVSSSLPSPEISHRKDHGKTMKQCWLDLVKWKSTVPHPLIGLW